MYQNAPFSTIGIRVEVVHFWLIKSEKALKNQDFFVCGGGGWIRTTVGIASRFTD